MPRVHELQWLDGHAETNFPFASTATLNNGRGGIIDPRVFADASLYPIGASNDIYLRQVTVTNSSVILTLGSGSQSVASAEFDLLDPPERLVTFTDGYGRPAGVIVSERSRLSMFQSWKPGTYNFERRHTEFAGACVVPLPDTVLRSVTANDVTSVGRLAIVGGAGVTLTTENKTYRDKFGETSTKKIIRVHAVGDPLFKRTVTEDALPGSFRTPRFLKEIVLTTETQSVTLTPDSAGYVSLFAGNVTEASSALRIVTDHEGIRIELLGVQSPNRG